MFQSNHDEDDQELQLINSMDVSSEVKELIHCNNCLIFRFPDSTYSHAYKLADDTWVQMKGDDQKGVNQEQEIYDIYNFVDRNLKHIVNPEKAVTLYFRNRVMLYLVSIATLAYSLAFVHFLNDHTHYAAQALGTTHTTYCESAYSLVNFLTCIFGLYTIHSHRVELFTRHQRLIILSVIIDFVLTNTFPQLAILLAANALPSCSQGGC